MWVFFVSFGPSRISLSFTSISLHKDKIIFLDKAKVYNVQKVFIIVILWKKSIENTVFIWARKRQTIVKQNRSKSEKGIRYISKNLKVKIEHYSCIPARGVTKFGIKVLWRPVSGVFDNLKFKISEGSDQNWSCPESAQMAVSAKLRQLAGQTQDNFNFGLSFLKF